MNLSSRRAKVFFMFIFDTSTCVCDGAMYGSGNLKYGFFGTSLFR